MMRLLLFNLATDADDPVLGYTTTWLNALAGQYEAVDVITMRAGRLAVASNVTVYSLGKEWGYSEPRRALRFYTVLTRLLWQHHYDAAFAHMAPLFAVMAAPLLKVRGVRVTVWYAHKHVGRVLRWAERVAYRVVSASADSFRLPTTKLRILRHGIDTNWFRPAENPPRQRSGLVVTSVSRLSPIKRIEVIIASVVALRGRGVPARLVIAGEATDDAYDALVHREAAALGDAVTFLGGVPFGRVRDVYWDADVMMNLCATGSIDKALVEAMACGLPVVTSNESFVDLLAPWGDLLYIPPGDDAPERVADSLARLAALSATERAQLGLSLRALAVQNYSLETLIERLIKVMMTGEDGA